MSRRRFTTPTHTDTEPAIRVPTSRGPCPFCGAPDSECLFNVRACHNHECRAFDRRLPFSSEAAERAVAAWAWGRAMGRA